MILRAVEFREVPSVGEFGSLLSLINHNLAKEVRKFRKTEDQYRSFLGKLLILDTISGITGVAPSELRIDRTRYNRPWIDLKNTPDFNISHSGSFIVIAVSEHRVGIDIEKLNLSSPPPSEVFCSEPEIAHIKQLSPEKQPEEIFRIWVLKESLLKAYGSGFSLPPSRITVVPRTDSRYSSLVLGDIPGYLIGISVKDPGEELTKKIQVISDKELKESYIKKTDIMEHHQKKDW